MKNIFYRIRHLSKRRRNRVLAAIAAVNLFLAFLISSNLFVYPNTYLGAMNVSGNTANQIRARIDAETNNKPTIQVKERTYIYTYAQMGVVVDAKKAIDETFSPNRKIFPLNLLAYLQSLFTKRTVDPPLAFTQDFDQFVTDSMFDFNLLQDDIAVDPATQSLVVTEHSEAYRFDKQSLKSLLLSRFGHDTRTIYPMLAKVTNATIDQIADMNQKIARVYDSPIVLYMDLGGTTQAVELKEEDIRQSTTITFDRDAMNAGISVKPEALNAVIVRRVHESGFPIRTNVVTQNVVSDFTKAISLRLEGQEITAVSTTPGAGPTTNGTLAEKYIEIDIAQAKMYLFKNGKVVKSYPVSTGLDYPTPTGKFAIINKVGLGFSNIYQTWLPWWMGFSYSKELNAYFGIHEQPYRLTADGKIVSASPQSIGTPSTGGCVALAPGAAREVYAFGDIGTPVYIFN